MNSVNIFIENNKIPFEEPQKNPASPPTDPHEISLEFLFSIEDIAYEILRHLPFNIVLTIELTSKKITSQMYWKELSIKEHLDFTWFTNNTPREQYLLGKALHHYIEIKTQTK